MWLSAIEQDVPIISTVKYNEISPFLTFDHDLEVDSSNSVATDSSLEEGASPGPR